MGDQRAARAYLNEAFDDYDALYALIDSNHYKQASFNVQQCIEKGLKALAYYSSNNVPYSVHHEHDINTIYQFAYNNIGYDETLFPSFITQYMPIITEWETKGRYPALDFANWLPDSDEMEYMNTLASLIPSWLGEVEYVIDNNM